MTTQFDLLADRAKTGLRVNYLPGDGVLQVIDASRFVSPTKVTCSEGFGPDAETVYTILVVTAVDTEANTLTVSGPMSGYSDVPLPLGTFVAIRGLAEQYIAHSTAINALESGGGTGTVTSVAVTVPSGLGVSGSPITSNGTIAITTALNGLVKGTGTGFTTASAGTDYVVPSGNITGTAGTITGSITESQVTGLVVGLASKATDTAVVHNTGNETIGGTKTFTSTITGSVSGTASGLSATLPINEGGTGQTTASAALNALLPSQTGDGGKVLGTNGTAASWVTASGGSPGGSTGQLQYNASGSFGGDPFITTDANGTLSIGNSGNGLVTDITTATMSTNAAALTLTQTGGLYGTTSLTICNATNENGAIFTNDGVALVDFIFNADGIQRNIRFEARSGVYATGSPEFQFGTAGSPSFITGDNGVISNAPCHMKDNAYIDGKLGVNTESPSYGYHQVGGCSRLQAIIPPTPSITQVGTAGSTQWYYWIVVKDGIGNYTGLSIEGTTTTSNATLSGTNYNVITFNRVDGAYEYFVLRAFSDGLDPGWYIGGNSMIGSVLENGSSTYSINDQIPGDPYIFAGPISVINQTGNAQIDGSLTLGAGNDETCLTINATNNNQQNFDALVVNGLGSSQAGIDQNACVRTATTTGMPTFEPNNFGAMAYDPSSCYLWINANSGWVALQPPVSGSANNPPDLSTFTAYGYAMSATGQSFAYSNEISPACTYVEYTSLNAGAHQPAAWVIPIPGGSSRWTAIAQVQGNVGTGWAASFGLCMLESSTGKMVTWGPIYNYGAYGANSWGLTCNTPGTGVGGSFGTGVYSATQAYEMQWLKIAYDSDNSTTQAEAYLSCDGRNFTHITSLAFSGNFTSRPDSVGLGGDVYVGFSNDPTNRGGWNVFNWSFSSDA